jgi:hypothetical protein
MSIIGVTGTAKGRPIVVTPGSQLLPRSQLLPGDLAVSRGHMNLQHEGPVCAATVTVADGYLRYCAWP